MEHYSHLKFTLGKVTALTSKDNLGASQKSFGEKKGYFTSSHLGMNEPLLKKSKCLPRDIQFRSTELLSCVIDEWPEN